MVLISAYFGLFWLFQLVLIFGSGSYFIFTKDKKQRFLESSCSYFWGEI